jgi:hypothetical protein
VLAVTVYTWDRERAIIVALALFGEEKKEEALLY